MLEPVPTGPSEDVTLPVGNGPSVEKVKLGTVGNAEEALELPVIGLFSSVVTVLLPEAGALDDGTTSVGDDDGMISVTLVSIEDDGVGKTSVIIVGVKVDSGPSVADDDGNTSVIVVSPGALDDGKTSVRLVSMV